jgi:hypothetical protein
VVIALEAVDLALPGPRLGLPLIDCPALDDLGAACTELRRATFQFVLAPMRIHGTTGLPVNPLAVF